MRNSSGVIIGFAIMAIATRTQESMSTHHRPASLEDTDYEVWSITKETSSTFGANSLKFTLSADGEIASQGNWRKLTYWQFVPKLGERLIGTAISTSEEADGGFITFFHFKVVEREAFSFGAVQLVAVPRSICLCVSLDCSPP